MTVLSFNVGLQIKAGWATADQVHWPERLPETDTSRAQQQELFGRMNQVDLLSFLHIVVNL